MAVDTQGRRNCVRQPLDKEEAFPRPEPDHEDPATHGSQAKAEEDLGGQARLGPLHGGSAGHAHASKFTAP